MTAAAAAAPIVPDLRLRRLRDRVGQLRELLADALHLIGELYESDDWKLVASSWEEFCAAELPELARLRLEPEQRQAVVVDLAGRGLSQRAIGAPLGLSPQTVGRELKAAGVARTASKGRDGRVRTIALKTSPETGHDAVTPQVTKAQQTIDLVAAAGERGLTVRELCKRTGWHHGQASGQLSRLNRRGRVRQTPVFRDGCSAYVAP